VESPGTHLNSQKLTKLNEKWQRKIIQQNSITSEDIYNFDETDFAIGLARTTEVITCSDN
jgi:hypothetical protein